MVPLIVEQTLPEDGCSQDAYGGMGQVTPGACDGGFDVLPMASGVRSGRRTSRRRSLQVIDGRRQQCRRRRLKGMFVSLTSKN
jgi:hypothetical protein